MMATGKEIFDELEQYPLSPTETGVKDYIFYFVSKNDYERGGAAHAFFDNFYKNHGYVGKGPSSWFPLIPARRKQIGSGEASGGLRGDQIRAGEEG